MKRGCVTTTRRHLAAARDDGDAEPCVDDAVVVEIRRGGELKREPHRRYRGTKYHAPTRAITPIARIPGEANVEEALPGSAHMSPRLAAYDDALRSTSVPPIPDSARFHNALLGPVRHQRPALNRDDNADPIDAEPIESSEQAEPIEPTDRKEPDAADRQDGTLRTNREQ